MFFDKFIMASAAFQTLPVKFINIIAGDREKEENKFSGLYYEYSSANPAVIPEDGSYVFRGSTGRPIKIEKNPKFMLDKSNLTSNSDNAKELLKMIIDNTDFNYEKFSDAIAKPYLDLINNFIPQPLGAAQPPPQSAGSRNRRSRKNRSKKSKKSKSRKH